MQAVSTSRILLPLFYAGVENPLNCDEVVVSRRFVCVALIEQQLIADFRPIGAASVYKRQAFPGRR
jgi:hypothetical protein